MVCINYTQLVLPIILIKGKALKSYMNEGNLSVKNIKPSMLEVENNSTP